MKPESLRLRIESSEPLTTTPGFELSESTRNKFLIHTITEAEFGFINSGWSVFGSANRIEGGGVFELVFPAGVDLFRDVNFAPAKVQSEYGHGNQYIGAHRVSHVPDSGATVILLSIALTVLGLGRRFVCD